MSSEVKNLEPDVNLIFLTSCTC